MDDQNVSLAKSPREPFEDIEALIAELQADTEACHTPDEYASETHTEGKAFAYPQNLLQTNPSRGLSIQEVEVRLKKYGLNQLKQEKENPWLAFALYFIGPIQFVMEGAAILAAGLGDWVDLGIISGLLIVNSGVGFVQDRNAKSTVEALKNTLTSKATVLRDGTRNDIHSTQIAVGEIVLLEEGAIIPADGRIVTKDAHLQVDQSSVTGESLAVNKYTSDDCLASTAVKRGSASMLVTATGDRTQIGRAATLVGNACSSPGHFTGIVKGIGSILLVLVILDLFVIWTFSFYENKPMKSILQHSLAIFLIGVPVGLPVVVTTTMAVGASFLARKSAIVQRLCAIESLAGVEILCSDKTGTLTKNKLTLAEPFVLSTTIDADSDLVLTACLACSHSKKGLDAIDRAFLLALPDYPLARAILPHYKTLSFQPFDPVAKKVTAHVESPKGEKLVCVKGAPRTILKTVTSEGSVSQDLIDTYNSKVVEYASRGYRALGVARKKENKAWDLLGIMPCMDPPRHDTARTIQEAKELGLTIKMLTGDATEIARETCSQLGLGTNIHNADSLISGHDVISDESELYEIIKSADGFADVFPEHKYDVVDLLQKHGHLVAMTGDGVNDAPALKRADTGIAVEGSSDAARSAADIVFLAPGLSAIIDAIKTARQIFHRMYAYIVYRIALSLHLEIFLCIWIVYYKRSVNLTLLVFIAIFADIATLAVAYDNASYSKTPVKWNLARLWTTSIVHGILLAAGTWIVASTLVTDPRAIAIDQSTRGIVSSSGSISEILFLQIVLTENWLIFITRSNGPLLSTWPSWQLSGAVLTVDIAATLFCAFGIFGNTGTDWVTICRVWIFSFGIFIVMAAVHCTLRGTWLDHLLHWQQRRDERRRKDLEHLYVTLQSLSTTHSTS